MKTAFSPTKFLIPTGAGGLSIIPFAYLQYTTEHPKGLVALSHLNPEGLGEKILFGGLQVAMVLFASIHIFLMIRYLAQYFGWLGSDEHKTMKEDPISNAALMTPFLAIFMLFNVFIAIVRFFIPAFHDNLGDIVPIAFYAWAIVTFLALKLEISLLKRSFKKGFNMQQLNFGWLMHSFALGMSTTVGSGIAVFAKVAKLEDGATLLTGGWIPDAAALITLVVVMLGMFLFLVKAVSLFVGQYRSDGLPGRQAMPSFLIFVPIITMYAIAFYRLGHFLHKHHGFHISGAYDWFVLVGAYAFQVWYIAFGIALIKDYLTDHFKKEYYLSQWGLICPFAGFAVLGSVVIQQVPTLAPFLSVIVIITLIGGGITFFDLLIRHNRCKKDNSSVACM